MISKNEEIELLDRKNHKFNIQSVLDKKVDLYMILGKRNDGKTFGVVGEIIKEFLKTGTPSAYVRRYDGELNKTELRKLVNPHLENNGRKYPPFEKRTNGMYNDFDYYAGTFYPVYRDWETGKIEKRGKELLYTMALNTWEKSKGADRGAIKYILFDEFISRKGYLKDEVFCWENVISTLKRDRDIKIFMCANALNQFCPYLDYYQIFPEQYSPGSVVDFNYKTGLYLRFVWLPPSPEDDTEKRQNKFFGVQKNTASITKGTWDIDNYRLLRSGYYHGSESLYKVGIIFSRRSFVMEILCYKGEIYAFVYPSERHDDCIVKFTDDLFLNPDSDYMNNILQAGPVGDEIIGLFRQGKVYYNANTTGNIIDNWLQNFVAKKGVLKA